MKETHLNKIVGGKKVIGIGYKQFELGLRHFLETEYEDASRRFEDAIKRAGQNAKLKAHISFNCAISLLISDRLDESESHLKYFLSVYPKNCHAHCFLSTIYFKKGLFLDCQKSAQLAMRYGCEKCFKAWGNLALAKKRQGFQKEAVELLVGFMNENNPCDADTHEILIDVLTTDQD